MPKFKSKLILLVIPEDATINNSEFNPPQTTLTNNIPPATVTKNESLAAIFLFELEKTINSPLFSGTALEEKLITAMYTDAKVDDCQVDRTASTRIITANRVIKTLIREIDNFPIEVNSIIVPIKVLVIEATQYQALVPATCGHFKPIIMPSTPPIKFEEKKVKPTWEVYQVSWADIDYNKLLPILAWDNNDNGKEKQREKPT
ncbi:hypothetical protein G9A89_009918 [Geosiphon pyriformis]|nr:hypothetical protein G9A89_009918 [Geosiphon pyriformis]